MANHYYRRTPIESLHASYIGDCIECENCGCLTRAWDWTPHYDRFCLECIAGLEDADPRADRGDWRFHQDHDQ